MQIFMNRRDLKDIARPRLCMIAITAALFTVSAHANATNTCTVESALSPEQVKSQLATASSGDACAAQNLGNFYYTRQQYAEALRWYEKAASQGNSRVAFIISAMYRNGLLGTSHLDAQRARSWLEQAAKQGLDLAQVELGDQYTHGDAADPDMTQGMYWYEQAAKQGHAPAQYLLNELYLARSDEIQFSTDDAMESRYQGSKPKANYWLCRAALNNLPQAQYELSQAYDTGRGDLPMNQQQENLWLHKAAANGSQKAQAELTWLSQRSSLTQAKEYVETLFNPSETAANCPHDAAVLDL